MDAIAKSGAESLDKFIFRRAPQSASVLVPHEMLRFRNRYLEAKKSNDIGAGGTTMKEAPLWAPSGKNLTTPEAYIKISNAVKPDILQLLSDYDIDYRTIISKKRYEKAIKRTESWVEKQLELDDYTPKLVPLICHPDIATFNFHVENMKEILKDREDICGFALTGLDERIFPGRFDKLENRLSKISDAKKICTQIFKPADIIKGVLSGIDVFGGQYPVIMAESHKAIVLPSSRFPTRKMVILDITDENNAMNKENICEDSCIDYSIGYLHHLVKVKELLEPILLTQHNLDQMENFFALLREMKSDTARLSNLLNLIEAYF